MNELPEQPIDKAVAEDPHELQKTIREQNVTITYLQSNVDKLTKQKAVLEAANHEQSVSIMDLKYVPE
jgi:hypothetical protein